MFSEAVSLGLILLTITLIVLGISIWFLISSRKSLNEWATEHSWLTDEKPPTLMQSFKDLFRVRKKNRNPEDNEISHRMRRQDEPKKKKEKTGESFRSSTDALPQQSRFSRKRQKNEALDREQLDGGEQGLQKKVEQLQLLLAEKDDEVQQVKRYEAVAQKMTVSLENIHREFEGFQKKITALEKEAARAVTLTLELEDAKEMYAKAHRELARKQQTLDEAFAANQALQQQLIELEDKLQEANRQRQQLMKKIKLLEEINADFESIAQTNQKLQTDLRRIAEMESMLSIMAGEKLYTG